MREDWPRREVALSLLVVKAIVTMLHICQVGVWEDHCYLCRNTALGDFVRD